MERLESLRIAIVGCGRMGRVHAERIRADGRGEVVALFDSDRGTCERLRDEESSRADAFDDLESLLANSELDAVVIATPTSLHYEQVLACRERNLPVLCEKPLADTRERIVELIDASATGPVLMLGYQRRFWATYRTLRREIQSGKWGPIRAVVSHNVEDWQQTIAGTWRDDPRINPGGFVGDAGSHKIDALFHLTGLAATEVFARTWNAGSRVEISATIAGVLEGNVPLAMDFVGNARYRGEDLTVHCAEADWMLRGTVPAGQEVWVGREGRMARVTDLEPDSNPTVGFLDLLTAGCENPAPASCALPVYDFTRAVLDSAAAGAVVRPTKAECGLRNVE